VDGGEATAGGGVVAVAMIGGARCVFIAFVEPPVVESPMVAEMAMTAGVSGKPGKGT
jgi:hypothetical protein